MLEGRKSSWFVFVFDERQRRLMNLFVAVGVLAGVGFGCETKRFHHRIHSIQRLAQDPYIVHQRSRKATHRMTRK